MLDFLRHAALGAAPAAALFACLSSVLPAGAQGKLDVSLSATAPPPALSQGTATEALAFGAEADSSNPLGNSTFEKRWFDNLGPLPGTASQASSWDSSSALGYAHAPTTPSIPNGPTSLPAESGVNYSLSTFAGYLNVGSGTGNQAAGGTSGSVAFPIGHSFGLISNFDVGSIGGYSVYQGGTNLYWRDPGLGLIGATGSVGHFNSSFGGANFASGGANFEGYLDRLTPFATAGAFGVQSLKTKGYGTVGLAYYPTDNLQFALGGYDYGGYGGVQGGIEYLLPIKINGLATTVGADGFAGNHGTSGAMARLKFLFGPTPANNKTLIERRRQDDPIADNFSNYFSLSQAAAILGGTAVAFKGGSIRTVCNDGQSPSQTMCFCPPGDTIGTPPNDQCSLPSDIGLKRDIVKIGELINGIGLYRFRYIDGDQFYVGVMAQEVAAFVPDAVAVMPDGYHLRVIYARLGMRLQTWEEWTAGADDASPHSSPPADEARAFGGPVVATSVAPSN